MTEATLPSLLPESPLTRRLRFLGFDPWLLLLIAVMVTFGLVMVYSASWDVSWRLFQDPNALFRRCSGRQGSGERSHN